MERAAIPSATLVPSAPGALESDHRVANSLSLTAALLRMQRMRSTDVAVQSALRSAEARISSIANFHKYLHGHADHERIDLCEYLCEVLPQIDTGIGVRCMLAFNPAVPMEVPARVARSLTIIVNEFALNAFKHGYDGVVGGCITIELGRDGNGLRLTIADGGTGLPEHFDPETCDGHGMRIVSSLVREMDGTLACHTEGGAQFTIRIPES